MSKKTHRMAEIKEQEKAHRGSASGLKPSARVKPAAGKSASSRSAGGARVFDRAATANAAVNATSVRITGAVVAAAALLGGLFWALSANGSYSSGMLIGLVLLGIVAGLGVFSAVRASDVASRMRAQRRR
jgi:hypothetical protein